MFQTCLYTGDYDDEGWCEIHHDGRCVSEYDETCCECGGTIPAGTPHDLYVGQFYERRYADGPGEVETYLTCRACLRIWNSLTDEGRVIGSLADMLYESYRLGVDLVPEDEIEDVEDLQDRRRGHVGAALSELLAASNGEEQLSCALELLSPFLTEAQLVQVFSWATARTETK